MTANFYSQAAAKDGMPLFGTNIVVTGLWSVMRINFLPYRY